MFGKSQLHPESRFQQLTTLQPPATHKMKQHYMSLFVIRSQNQKGNAFFSVIFIYLTRPTRLSDPFHPSVFVFFVCAQHILKANDWIGMRAVVYVHTPTRKNHHHQATLWLLLYNYYVSAVKTAKVVADSAGCQASVVVWTLFTVFLSGNFDNNGQLPGCDTHSHSESIQWSPDPERTMWHTAEGFELEQR